MTFLGSAAQAQDVQTLPSNFDKALCMGEIAQYEGQSALDQAAWLIAMGANTGVFMSPAHSGIELSHTVPAFGYPSVFRMHAGDQTCEISKKTFEDFGPKILMELMPQDA